jgi:hypothetical protein
MKTTADGKGYQTKKATEKKGEPECSPLNLLRIIASHDKLRDGGEKHTCTFTLGKYTCQRNASHLAP